MEARKMAGLLQATAEARRLASEGVGDEDRMLVYLGRVLRRERKERDIILAEVVAVLKRSGIKIRTDAPLSRFERGDTTPHYLDAVVAAYAEVFGVSTIGLWEEALEEARSAEESD
jgi:hypothetical protein